MRKHIVGFVLALLLMGMVGFTPSVQASVFGNGSRAEFSDSSAFTLPDGGWTISFWAKPDDPCTAARILYSHGTSGQPRLYMDIQGSATWPINGLRVTYNSTTANDSSGTNSSRLGGYKVWCRVTLVRSASDHKIRSYMYVPGVGETLRATSASVSGSTSNPSGTLYLGGTNWWGQMAEWAKWDRELSAEERTELNGGELPEDVSGGAPVWHLPLFNNYTSLSGDLSLSTAGTAWFDPTDHPVDRGPIAPLPVTMVWPLENEVCNHRGYIAWHKNSRFSPQEQTYNVYLRKGSGDWQQIGSNLTGRYCDTGVLDDASTYSVRVDAKAVAYDLTTEGTVITFTTSTPSGTVYYVGPTATSSGNGSTPSTPMPWSGLSSAYAGAVIRIVNPDATIFYEYESLNNATYTEWPNLNFQSRQVIEYGITRTFQDWRGIRRFADGSYGVEHQLVIVDYDPPYAIVSGKVHNGMMVNPVAGGQGLDQKPEATSGTWNARSNRGDEIPLRITGGSRPYSVLNCDSLLANDTVRTSVDARYNMRNFSILTVLDELPANNLWFRPSYRYFEGNGLKFRVSDIRYDRVSQVDIGGSGAVLTPGSSKARSVQTQDFPSFERCVSRPTGEFCAGWVNTHCHAWEASQCYAGYWAQAVGDVFLALHASDLGELETTKRRTLIGVFQRGIDCYGVVKQGYTTWWNNDGGTRHGRYWPIVFAGIVFDDTEMKAVGATTHQDKDDPWNYEGGVTFMDNGQFVQLVDNADYLGVGKPFFVSPPWEVTYNIKNESGVTLSYDVTGTCNVVKNSTTVTISDGDTWATGLAGRKFMTVYTDDGKILCLDESRNASYTLKAYTIASHTSTELTLSSPYLGESHEGVAFRIANGVFLGKQYEYSKCADYSEFDVATWADRYWWINKPHMGPITNWPYGGLSMTGSVYAEDGYQSIVTCSMHAMVLSAVIMNEHEGYPAVSAWNSPQTFGYFNWANSNLGGEGQPEWGNYESGWATSVGAQEWTWPLTDWEAPPVSEKAYDPSPASGAVDVSISPTLSWTAGAGAETHKIYLGTTSGNLSLVDTQSAIDTDIDVGPLEYNTLYFWRVDELLEEETTTGWEWYFTTEAEPVDPSPNTYILFFQEATP